MGANKMAIIIVISIILIVFAFGYIFFKLGYGYGYLDGKIDGLEKTLDSFKYECEDLIENDAKKN